MKKVVDINLGGQKFTIDEDAYQDLDQYLNSINRHFSTSSGFEDIIYDIENRIAELLSEGRDGNNIITLKKVEEIKFQRQRRLLYSRSSIRTICLLRI